MLVQFLWRNFWTSETYLLAAICRLLHPWLVHTNCFLFFPVCSSCVPILTDARKRSPFMCFENHIGEISKQRKKIQQEKRKKHPVRYINHVQNNNVTWSVCHVIVLCSIFNHVSVFLLVWKKWKIFCSSHLKEDYYRSPRERERHWCLIHPWYFLSMIPRENIWPMWVLLWISTGLLWSQRHPQKRQPRRMTISCTWTTRNFE